MKLARACIVLSVLIMAGLTLPELGWAQSGSNAAVEAFNRGTDLAKAGQYREAIQYLDQAIRLDPQYAQAYTNRGSAYSHLGQHQRAIEDYTEAIRLDPRLALAYTNRGLAYGRLGQYQRAIEDLDQAIRLDPRDAKAYTNRGLAYGRLGQYQRAIEDLDQAIRLDPRDAKAYTNRGIAYSQLDQYERAIQDYNEAIRLDPRNAAAYRSRGIASLISAKGNAVTDAQKYLDLKGWQDRSSQYAVIIAHFGARQAGLDAESRMILDEAKARCDISAWPYPIIQHLLGQMTDKQLLTEATTNDKMTEARTYVGLGQSLAGNKADARMHLDWVVKNGNRSFIEYRLARATLERMSKD